MRAPGNSGKWVVLAEVTCSSSTAKNTVLTQASFWNDLYHRSVYTSSGKENTAGSEDSKEVTALMRNETFK